jgi:ribonuclease P protein component
VLPADRRLTRPASFRRAFKAGRRSGARTLVTHVVVAGDGTAGDEGVAEAAGPQVGFVVSKAVGNAVVRNRVKRRLRHLARERIDLLDGVALLVVRAQPPAATASSAELGSDLDRCLERSLGTLAGSGQADR